MVKVKQSRLLISYFVILFILILTTIATHYIPAGSYQKGYLVPKHQSEDGKGKKIIPQKEYHQNPKAYPSAQKVIIQKSYHQVTANPQGILDLLLSPVRGFVRNIGIMVFILVVGGAFAIFHGTGTLNGVVMALIDRYRDNAPRLIIYVMLIFGGFASTFGLFEEFVPYILVLIPIFLLLGYDVIIPAAIVLVGAGVGFASATMNPFTLVIAQEIADVPIYSGFSVRLVIFAVFMTIAIKYVLSYARRIQKHPETSLVREMGDDFKKELVDESRGVKLFTREHKRVLLVVLTGIAIMILTTVADLILRWQASIELPGTELRLLIFLLMGIGSGIAGQSGWRKTLGDFGRGIWAFAPAIIIISLAQAIVVIAEDGKIIHTILKNMADTMETLPANFSAAGMFVMQSVINFFIPSGSGQALLTMPIMAPLSDLLGVSRQMAVLAFQFGDGFSNIMFPTNGLLMIGLSIANIPWIKWFRWILPLQVLLFAAGFAILYLLSLVQLF
jgi:uncharacterized ion transporter superfamily protein YfcC